MLKMPERKETNPNEVMWSTPQSYRDEGWNACHDQWLAYLKQEVIKAQIDILTWSLDPNENGKIEDDPYYLVEQRIAALQAELNPPTGEED